MGIFGKSWLSFGSSKSRRQGRRPGLLARRKLSLESLEIRRVLTSIGIFDSSQALWHTSNTNAQGVADNTFFYGNSAVALQAVAGDWDGTGDTNPGVFNPSSGLWFQREANNTGFADTTFFFGPSGSNFVALVGDWDGDGDATPGLYAPDLARWFLRNSNSTGAHDIVFDYGTPGGAVQPIAGDWDGDGVDTIGFYDNNDGEFHLRNSNSAGPDSATFIYGDGGPTLRAVAGDWNNDGISSPGLFQQNSGFWYLRDTNDTGFANVQFLYGSPSASNFPVVGTWTETTPPTVDIVDVTPDPRGPGVIATIQFSEGVENVDISDFSLDLDGSPVDLTGLTVTKVARGQYTINLSTVTNTGGTYTLSLNAAGSSITDRANNALTAGASDTWVVDALPPQVASINRLDANPTGQTTVNYRVTFAEDVTGVDVNDFSLNTTGNVTANIASVTPVGTGDAYTVTVSGITGNGTLRLDVLDNDTIVDAVGNKLGGTGAGNGDFSTGQVYDINNSNPTVASITRANNNPTGAASVDFTVTFTEAVTGVDVTDFGVNTTGATSGSVASVNGSGTTYIVTVNGISGDGTLRLDLLDDDSIADVLSNPLGGLGVGNGDFNTGEVYTVDAGVPTVLNITRTDPSPTNADSVSFSVFFTETVFGVDLGDFLLTKTGTVQGNITSVTGSGSNYTVTVGAIVGDGTLRLDLVDNDSIIDGAGNTLGGTGAGNGSFSTGDVYTLDNTVPVVIGITRTNANPTNANTVQYQVVFSEIVAGVNGSDFALTSTGTAAGNISTVGGSGDTYTVTVTGVTGNGSLRLDLVDNDSINDGVNNMLGGTGSGNGDFSTGEDYTIDRTFPVVSSITRLDSSPTQAASARFQVVFSESVTGVDGTDFTLSTSGGATGSIGAVTGSGTTYTVQVNSLTAASTGTVRLDLVDNDSIADLVGNALGGNGNNNGNFNLGEFYTLDFAPPTVLSIIRAGATPTSDPTVDFIVTFSEPVTGVVQSDFSLFTTGSASGNVSSLTGTGAVYTVTVSNVTGDGSLRLDYNDNDNAQDIAGNLIGGTGTGNGDFNTGEEYTIDNTNPLVTSIVRSNPNPTTATLISFTVTFSETVTGVDLSDFVLVKTGTADGNLASVTGSGAVYTVNVNSVFGDGTIGLNLVDDDSIQDGDSNAIGGAGAGNGDFDMGQVYTVDNTIPEVLSIDRTGVNPTNGTSIIFAVTFSEDVTGVDINDFSLATTGTVTGVIASVFGSGDSYTVTVNQLAGSGNARLDLFDNDSIRDSATNPLGDTGTGNGDFQSGQEFTIDRQVPQVVSIVRAGADPTNSSSVDFTVTFSEPVSGVNLADFSLTKTGNVVATLASVTGTGAAYTVTVNGITGNGTLRLDLNDNDSIADSLNNKLGGAGAGNGDFNTGQVYTIDSLPTVASIVRLNPASPTSATLVRFTVTFSESVTGVDSADFVPFTTGTATGVVESVTGSGASYTVTVVSVAGDGLLRLDVLDDDSIKDTDLTADSLSGTGIGNGNFNSGQAFTIDNVPRVANITRASASPNNGSTVDFTVTFTESVSGVDVTDFTLVSSGTAAGNIATVSGSGNTYTVTINAVTGDGTLKLNLVDNDSIEDTDGIAHKLAGVGAGNGNFSNGEVYTIDHTDPVVTQIVEMDGNPTNKTSIRYEIIFSEAITPGTLTVADLSIVRTGTATGNIGALTFNGTTYELAITGVSGNGTLQINLTDDDSITDIAGNKLGGTGAGNGSFDGNIYEVDNIDPDVVGIVRLDVDPNTTTSVRFGVLFDDEMTNLDLADFALATTGAVTGTIASITGSGDTWTVTVNNIAGDGTLKLDLVDNDTVTDLATNPLGGPGPVNGSFDTGQFYTIDQVPKVLSITRQNPNPTNRNDITYRVTFSEDVTGVDITDFTITKTGILTGTVSSVSGGGDIWDVLVTNVVGDGTMKLNLIDDDSIEDTDGTIDKLAGSGINNGTFTTGEIYTVDQTPPTTVSITRVNPSPTAANIINFRVEFSEPVTGVNLGDFVLTAPPPSTAAGTLFRLTGSNAVYNVEVRFVIGDGLLRLDLIDDDSIIDAATNPLDGDFTSGEAYLMDNTGPEVVSIVRMDPNFPTVGSTVHYRVTFDEDVNFVTENDFTIFGSGTGTVGVVNGADKIWVVEVLNVGSQPGHVIRLDVVDFDAIQDDYGNPLGGPGNSNGNFNQGQTYTIG